MYAVISSGGKQFRVQKGETLHVEKIPGAVGAVVSFDKVLMFSDGKICSIGRPYLGQAKVSGRITEQKRSKKILVFKYKRRKRYRRKQGHRQPYTAVQIDHIEYQKSDKE